MLRYVKGARSERELLGKFHSMGYSVIRSAGSGVSSLCPDIVVVRKKTCMSFECKAWDRNRLSIDKESFLKLKQWKDNTEFPTFIAWRMNNMGWFFIELEELKAGEKDYSITKKRTLEIGRRMEGLHIKLQDVAQEGNVAGNGINIGPGTSNMAQPQ